MELVMVAQGHTARAGWVRMSTVVVRLALAIVYFLMLGHGESEREVEQTMDDLREHGVDVVTFGQYLRPSMLHLPVREHVTPARFAALEQRAQKKGFLYVASGPLVRSSYKAAEFYIAGMLRQRRDLEAARNASQPAKETE